MPKTVFPDLSHLPPGVQQSIRSQLLMQKIQQYGTKKVEVQMKDGRTGVMDEKPFMHQRDVAILEDFVDLDEGCESWLVGEKYPMRICINPQRIDNVHRFKKVIPILFRSFQGNPLRKATALLYFYWNWKLYVEFLYMAWRDVYYPEVKYYSQPVREFLRVFDKLGIWEMAKMVFCTPLESDTAYRYRVQDWFVLIDKALLVENPTKELKRVLDIWFEREITNAGLGRFRSITPYLIFYLKFINRKLLKTIVDFILECDIEEIRSSKEDLYYQNCINEDKDYQYRGIPAKERYQDYLTEKNSMTLEASTTPGKGETTIEPTNSSTNNPIIKQD